MLKDGCINDEHLLHHFSHGLPLAGGVFRHLEVPSQFVPPALNVVQVRASARWVRAAARRRGTGQEDPEVARRVLEKTQEEAGSGWLRGPSTEQD